jgi:hypothetical protein
MITWRTLAGLGLALLIWAGWYRGSDLTRWFEERYKIGQTTGDIYVSGPQVYTRERLVNDRYREDAWYSAMLDQFKPYGPTEFLSRNTNSDTQVTLGLGVAATPPTTLGTPQPPGGAGAGGTATSPAALPSVDEFDDMRTYRERVRNRMIENQLDDRHDIRGNSLYRLGFDAAVLPGTNTRKSAKISISILPPDGLLPKDSAESSDDALRDIEKTLANLSSLFELKSGSVWERTYLRWLESLGKRFDDARKSLRTSYDENRFTPDQYEKLLASVRKTARDLANGIDPLIKEAGDKGIQDYGIPDKYENWNRDSFFDLANKVSAQSYDIASSASAFASIMKDFREEYSRGSVKPSDPAHKAYKDEIDRLIDVANQERALWSFVNTRLNPPPNIQSGNQQPATTENECQNIQNYFRAPQVTDTPPLQPVDLQPIDQNDFADPLTYFLDIAFEGDLAEAVLGQRDAQTGRKLTALDTLITLTEVNQKYGSSGRAFFFNPRVASLDVIVDENCIPEQMKSNKPETNVHQRKVFALGPQIENIRRYLPEFDWRKEIERLYETRDLPRDAEPNTIKIGLINFIRKVGLRLDAFSYAFTPSEPEDFIATKSSDDQNAGLSVQAGVGSAGGQGGGGVNASRAKQTNRSRNAERERVVSFGAEKNAATPTFGWIIQPEEPADDDSSYHQRALQTRLAALVSLPAWWEELRLRVKQSWVDESDDSETPPKVQDFTIELPVNFETVEASLFVNDRSPVVFEEEVEGLTVRPCEKAEILIPGRRLWRSTVVTLGGQRANGIFVLPDMNGIIATFNKIHYPSGWSDDRLPRQLLTVWTSQGSITLKVPVTLKLPFRTARPQCSDDEPTPSDAGAAIHPPG